MQDDTPYPPPWNEEALDGGLIFAVDDGWFELERAEHDGREWIEGYDPPGPSRGYPYVRVAHEPGRRANDTWFCRSANLEKSTSVEGPAHDIPRLLQAIKTWTHDHRKRWAFYPLTEDVGLVWSPRNSRTSTRVTRRALEALLADANTMKEDPCT